MLNWTKLSSYGGLEHEEIAAGVLKSINVMELSNWTKLSSYGGLEHEAFIISVQIASLQVSLSLCYSN